MYGFIVRLIFVTMSRVRARRLVRPLGADSLALFDLLCEQEDSEQEHAAPPKRRN